METVKLMIKNKAPVTPDIDPTAFVQRFENMSVRCGNTKKYVQNNIFDPHDV